MHNKKCEMVLNLVNNKELNNGTNSDNTSIG